VIAKGLEGLETFIVEDAEELMLQPAESPVWDTAWAAVALEEAGLSPEHPSLQKAGEWLLTQEIRLAGDWRIKDPDVEPGGWAFEFENDWYPDLDDSAVVPRALVGMRLDAAGEAAKIPAIERALRWVLALQSKDGGWAAFDRDNNKQALYQLPFSEFMSPLDPTCSDVTAHVIEMLSLLRRMGWNSTRAPVQRSSLLAGQITEADSLADPLRRSIEYLKRTQETDGAWYGRWGVNYLYGTGLTLAALAAAGERMDQTYVRNAVSWLLSVQNADGGWGETCETYVNPSLRGCGVSTASQTAWVLIGLVAAIPQHGREMDREVWEAIRRGVEFLLNSQQVDGGWQEDEFTGGGFPKVFYLRYELYKIYFPLLALARVRELIQPASPADQPV
jgi:squalene-hopene/tetraprenyl-beta-curcumene cyclase